MLEQALAYTFFMYGLSVALLTASLTFLLIAVLRVVKEYQVSQSDRKKLLRPESSMRPVIMNTKGIAGKARQLAAMALLAVFLALSFGQAMPAAAQPVAPIVALSSGLDHVSNNIGALHMFRQATATPAVTISIPIDQIFSSVNTWIATLIPIYSIPAGIAIAVAILGLVVTLIVVAFGRKGSR